MHEESLLMPPKSVEQGSTLPMNPWEICIQGKESVQQFHRLGRSGVADASGQFGQTISTG
jgi:hypothetical protein